MLYARFVATVPYLLMSTKCWDFLTPSWLPCHIQKSADFVPFVCFLGTPLPLPVRTSYMEGPLRRFPMPKSEKYMGDVANVVMHGFQGNLLTSSF